MDSKDQSPGKLTIIVPPIPSTRITVRQIKMMLWGTLNVKPKEHIDGASDANVRHLLWDLALADGAIDFSDHQRNWGKSGTTTAGVLCSNVHSFFRTHIEPQLQAQGIKVVPRVVRGRSRTSDSLRLCLFWQGERGNTLSLDDLDELEDFYWDDDGNNDELDRSAGKIIAAEEYTQSTSGEAKDAMPDSQIAEWREGERRYSTPAAITELISQYYGNCDHGNLLKRYSVICSGKKVHTTVYASEQMVPLNYDLRKLPVSVQGSHLPVESTALKDAYRVQRAPIKARLKQLGVTLYNDPLYRLMGFKGGERPKITLSLTDFFKYRYSAGLLADELIDALVQTKGNIPRIISEKSHFLQIRSAMMPTLLELDNYPSRICGGGIGALVAWARNDDFVIALQIRGTKVSDGRGRRAVIPKAFHGPIVGDVSEADFSATLLREMFEEVYGGEEVKRRSQKFKWDFYVDREPGIRFLRDNLDACRMRLTSFGLNAIAGNYDVGILLAILDPGYWTQFEHKIKESWERTDIQFISTKEPDQLAQVIVDPSLAPESLPHLVEGLLALKELDPSRVTLPKIERRMGE